MSPDAAVRDPAGVVASSRAMATDVRITAPAIGNDEDVLATLLSDALGVFGEVERTCTRFDTASPLMQANAAPQRWVAVGSTCFEALVSAHRAHLWTRGRFDPRILNDLVGLGYDRSFRFGHEDVVVDRALPSGRRTPRAPWRPRFRGATEEVRLGDLPIDLGGIGKGLALRWASRQLRSAGVRGHLVEAGGDCFCSGVAANGDPWRVGVEDPSGGARPLAVLAVADQAVATSSVRVRQWTARGRRVHHLVDPRTGLPGGAGLAAVTVVHPDPATAEVWSKALFLEGSARIAAAAEHKGLAALFVRTDGSVGTSHRMTRHVIWSAA